MKAVVLPYHGTVPYRKVGEVDFFTKPKITELKFTESTSTESTCYPADR